jgi:hypothetical protein
MSELAQILGCLDAQDLVDTVLRLQEETLAIHAPRDKRVLTIDVDVVRGPLSGHRLSKVTLDFQYAEKLGGYLRTHHLEVLAKSVGEVTGMMAWLNTLVSNGVSVYVHNRPGQAPELRFPIKDEKAYLALRMDHSPPPALH